MTAAAVILGMHVNGYGIAQSLTEGDVENIIGIDVVPSVGLKSNMLDESHIIEDYPMPLYHKLLRLRERYDHLVLYPTSDDFLRHLVALQDHLPFCGLPYNPATVTRMQKKNEQYRAAIRCGVPVPEHFVSKFPFDWQDVAWMWGHVPCIIKPLQRKRGEAFRNHITSDPASLGRNRAIEFNGSEYLVSETVPPAPDNIFAYTCYRSAEGEILAEWTGQKIQQYPDDFGVFSTARNTAPDLIRKYGRCLVEEMDLHGITQSEYRKDWISGEYKLMEVNLRSMMWHRVGALSGVNLPLVQWCDMTGQPVPEMVQHQTPHVYLTYGHHALWNGINGRNNDPRLTHMARQAFLRGERRYAFASLTDPFPWAIDTVRTMKGIIGHFGRWNHD